MNSCICCKNLGKLPHPKGHPELVPGHIVKIPGHIVKMMCDRCIIAAFEGWSHPHKFDPSEVV